MAGRGIARSVRLAVGLGALALVAAACSSSPSSTAKVKTSKPVTPSTTAAPVLTVNTGTATVSGKPTTVLTNSKGMTLYYFDPDTSAVSACTATTKLPDGKVCTTVWPPLVLATGIPGSLTALPGTLSAVSDGNGRQVEYQGHPLYTFSGDTAPGQANGEGLLGKWWVATPSLAAAASPSSSRTSYGSTGSKSSTSSSSSSSSSSKSSGSSSGY